MTFWQILLIVACSVAACLVISLGIVYIIFRIRKKATYSVHKREKVPQARNAESPGPPVRRKAKDNEDTLAILLENHKKNGSKGLKTDTVNTKNPPAKHGPINVTATPVVKQSLQLNPGKSRETPHVPAMTKSRVPEVVRSQKQNEHNGKRAALKENGEKITETNLVSAIKITAPAALGPDVSMKDSNMLRTLVEPLKPPKSDVLKELESNFSIATKPWSGKPVIFQTTAWDQNKVNLESELENQRGEIYEVYIDIRLANSIAWLTNEVGRTSSDLDESYKQLCSKIEERLEKILSSKKVS